MRILTEPRNALVKQYQRLMELDGLTLEFTPEALRGIAHLAIERKSGARGLRAIIERVLLDTMFDLPVREEIVKCIVTGEAINGGAPTLVQGDAPRKIPVSQPWQEKREKRAGSVS